MSSRVNFTNILRAAFMHTDPKSAKRQSSHEYFSVLIGSAWVKAARKVLVKLTPDIKIFKRLLVVPLDITRMMMIISEIVVIQLFTFCNNM